MKATTTTTTTTNSNSGTVILHVCANNYDCVHERKLFIDILIVVKCIAIANLAMI